MLLTIQGTDKNDPMCEACNKYQVLDFCETCSISICNQCRTNHKRHDTEVYIVKFEEYSKKWQNINEEINYFHHKINESFMDFGIFVQMHEDHIKSKPFTS